MLFSRQVLLEIPAVSAAVSLSKIGAVFVRNSCDVVKLHCSVIVVLTYAVCSYNKAPILQIPTIYCTSETKLQPLPEFESVC